MYICDWWMLSKGDQQLDVKDLLESILIATNVDIYMYISLLQLRYHICKKYTYTYYITIYLEVSLRDKTLETGRYPFGIGHMRILLGADSTLAIITDGMAIRHWSEIETRVTNLIQSTLLHLMATTLLVDARDRVRLNPSIEPSVVSSIGSSIGCLGGERNFSPFSLVWMRAEAPFSRLRCGECKRKRMTRTYERARNRANVCLVSASILHDLSDMQPQINAIKIEHPPYYCSSYTPPSAATTADHVQPAASFSEFQNLPLPLFLVDRVGVECGSRASRGIVVHVRCSLN